MNISDKLRYRIEVGFWYPMLDKFLLTMSPQVHHRVQSKLMNELRDPLTDRIRSQVMFHIMDFMRENSDK